MKTTKRTGDLIAACVFISTSIWVTLEAFRMPRGLFNIPGPGFYPALLGIAFFGLSLTLAWMALRYRRDMETVQIGHSNIWSVIVALCLVGFLLERIGFILTTILFLAFLLRKLSNLRWPLCIAWACIGTMGAYLFFKTLLGLRLPPLLIYW